MAYISLLMGPTFCIHYTSVCQPKRELSAFTMPQFVNMKRELSAFTMPQFVNMKRELSVFTMPQFVNMKRELATLIN